MKTLVDAPGMTTRSFTSAITHLKICLIHGYSIPAVLQFLQDTNSPLSPYAASALGELVHDGARLPETVLPALTNSLRDPRPMVRAYAAGDVAQFKEAAEPAAPALLDLWDDPDQSVRQSATNAFFELPSYSVLRPSRPPPLGMSQEQADMYERRYGTRLPPVRMSREQADMYERRYGIRSTLCGAKLRIIPISNPSNGNKRLPR
jgi:hypothetical protein